MSRLRQTDAIGREIGPTVRRKPGLRLISDAMKRTARSLLPVGSSRTGGTYLERVFIMTIIISTTTVRRLCAAEGYLELGMPDHALAELEAVSDAGPLDPHAQFLRGASLMAKQCYDDAVAPLQRAAMSAPAPYNRLAWLTLGECFRKGGREELAKLADKFAASPPETPATQKPAVNFAIVVQKWLGGIPSRSGLADSDPVDLGEESA